MDAIVTISLMTGNKSVGTIEKAVKLPAEVESSLDNNPQDAAQWILTDAYKQTFSGVEVVLPVIAQKKRGE